MTDLETVKHKKCIDTSDLSPQEVYERLLTLNDAYGRDHTSNFLMAFNVNNENSLENSYQVTIRCLCSKYNPDLNQFEINLIVKLPEDFEQNSSNKGNLDWFKSLEQYAPIISYILQKKNIETVKVSVDIHNSSFRLDKRLYPQYNDNDTFKVDTDSFLKFFAICKNVLEEKLLESDKLPSLEHKSKKRPTIVRLPTSTAAEERIDPIVLNIDLNKEITEPVRNPEDNSIAFAGENYPVTEGGLIPFVVWDNQDKVFLLQLSPENRKDQMEKFSAQSFVAYKSHLKKEALKVKTAKLQKELASEKDFLTKTTDEKTDFISLASVELLKKAEIFNKQLRVKIEDQFIDVPDFIVRSPFNERRAIGTLYPFVNEIIYNKEQESWGIEIKYSPLNTERKNKVHEFSKHISRTQMSIMDLTANNSGLTSLQIERLGQELTDEFIVNNPLPHINKNNQLIIGNQIYSEHKAVCGTVYYPVIKELTASESESIQSSSVHVVYVENPKDHQIVDKDRWKQLQQIHLPTVSERNKFFKDADIVDNDELEFKKLQLEEELITSIKKLHFASTIAPKKDMSVKEQLQDILKEEEAFLNSLKACRDSVDKLTVFRKQIDNGLDAFKGLKKDSIINTENRRFLYKAKASLSALIYLTENDELKESLERRLKDVNTKINFHITANRIDTEAVTIYKNLCSIALAEHNIEWKGI